MNRGMARAMPFFYFDSRILPKIDKFRHKRVSFAIARFTVIDIID
jgi:hypothetical protein